MPGRHRAVLAVVLAGLAGCASLARVVPVPGDGVVLDAGGARASTGAGALRLAVRPDAWQGEPAFLPRYVTPFHLELDNRGTEPLAYGYGDLRLFDDARFQYTALPPDEVGRLLLLGAGWELASASVVADASAPRRRRPVHWDPFWDWWRWPRGGLGYVPPRVDDVLLRALPAGPLHPGARVAGFVYFPRLRPEARLLRLEVHHSVDGVPAVLTVRFRVEAADRG